MIRSRACLALLAASALSAAGCAGCSSDRTSNPPAGVTCSSTTAAADAGELTGALAGAADGSCVLLSGASYAGSFKVPVGVTLASAAGTRAALTTGADKQPVVTLAERASLVSVDVTDASRVGVAVLAASAKVSDVHVTRAASAALGVRCDANCGAGIVELSNVFLDKSQLGLWVHGAHVVMNGGRSGDHTSASLSSALGVVGEAGARIELTSVTVEKNDGIGVLLDGAGTSASIKDSNVQDNADRGVWFQRLDGTIDQPALTLDGSNLVRNKIVGLGGVESRGIIIVGGRVAETIAAPIVTDIGSTDAVGDGIGILGGSTDFKLDGTTLEQNARAAGVIDGSDRGIIIVGGKVSAGPSGLKVVVQNTTADANIQVPDADKSMPPKALGVSATKITLPPVF